MVNQGGGEQRERPAYVRFERRAVEDRAATVEKGSIVMKDVDYAIITPVGTKDEIPREVKDWLPQVKQNCKEGRMPPHFEEHYTRLYEAWKKGEEPPVDGTPIKGWQLLSPAAQQNCIAANVRTVEDLAAANGEAKQRIGMGAEDAVQKAQSWLKASKDVGIVTAANAALVAENTRLKVTVADLEKKNAELVKQLTAAKVPA